jgi:hypothetical protein
MHRNLKLGPDTAVVSAAVTGGQLLEADSTNVGYVHPAGAASTTVVGVATADAQPSGTNPTNPLNISWAHPEVGIEYGPADVDVVYSTNAAYGQLLIAAANGQVAYSATPAVGTIVGRCTQPTGVVAGAAGRMRLFG